MTVHATDNALRHEFSSGEEDRLIVFDAHQADSFWNREGEVCSVFTDLSFAKALKFREEGIVSQQTFTDGHDYATYRDARAATDTRWSAANALRTEVKGVFYSSPVIDSLWPKNLFAYVLDWEVPKIVQDEFKVILHEQGNSQGRHLSCRAASVASAERILALLCKDTSMATELTQEKNKNPLVESLAEVIQCKMEPHFVARAT